MDYVAALSEGKNKGDGSDKPVSLTLAERCEKWNHLPHTGGMLDQVVWLMDQMEEALRAKGQWLNARRQANQAQIVSEA